MTSTSERLLSELSLFSGLELGDLPVRTTELAVGEELWRQGQPGDALYVVERGRLAVTARLPGGRESTLASVGPREVLGELALLDGGVRTASVRALEPARLVRLGYTEFQALVLRRDECARILRRRLTELACSRLRERHRALAATLPGAPVPAVAAVGEVTDPPGRAYLRRLPFFRHYGADEFDEFLQRVSVERVVVGTTLVAEGEPPRALFVTLNGAVEEVIRRDGGAIRVALAGPGRAFGYAGVVAGGAATASAVARERSLVLVADRRELDAHEFAAAIGHDVVDALRQAERPQARLAAARGEHTSGTAP
jgi:CRP-like cAMP-binding protein